MSLDSGLQLTMPFIALQEGAHVIPEEVADDVELECVDCGELVKPRGSYERDGTFVARHFWHPHGAPESCEAAGGESQQHQRMKSIAASKAKSRWPNATVDFEYQIGDRRTDVVVSFPEFHHRYGEGVAIEVQYKHENKNLGQVETDYQEHRYSTLWLHERHYDGKDVDLDAGEWRIWWANAVPTEQTWSGYHGVVHWLNQELSPNVPIEVTLPPEFLDSLESTLKGIWTDAKQESQTAEWDKLVESKISHKPAYLTLVKSPSNHTYLVLSKGYNSSYESVHAPIFFGDKNASKLRYFANSIEALGNEHDDFSDATAEDWETEEEVWLDTGTNSTKSLIKTIRPPDGSLALQLKKINNAEYKDVIVASPFDPYDIIAALRTIAQRLES